MLSHFISTRQIFFKKKVTNRAKSLKAQILKLKCWGDSSQWRSEDKLRRRRRKEKRRVEERREREKEGTLFSLSIEESAGRNGSGHVSGDNAVPGLNLEGEWARARSNSSSRERRSGCGSRKVNGRRGVRRRFGRERERNPRNSEECGWRRWRCREDKHSLVFEAKTRVISVCRRVGERTGHLSKIKEREREREREVGLGAVAVNVSVGTVQLGLAVTRAFSSLPWPTCHWGSQSLKRL